MRCLESGFPSWYLSDGIETKFTLPFIQSGYFLDISYICMKVRGFDDLEGAFLYIFYLFGVVRGKDVVPYCTTIF